MSEENKAIVRQVYEDVRSEGNLDLVDEIFDENYIGRDPTVIPQEVHGPEGFKQQTAGLRAAFPDLRFTIESLIAEGDEVVARWRARGTQRGELFGIAPTGREVQVSGFGSWRIVDGKIVEHWGNFDNLGMMHQLGVLPESSQMEEATDA
jgi:predicted ester cyclase